MITKNDAKQAFMDNLADYMRQHGMTQADLARALWDDASVNNRMKVSRWMAGKIVPNLHELANIAEAFDVSVDELIGAVRPQKTKTKK